MQTPTSNAAALMAPAHIVLDFDDGSEALEAVMVPARAPALLALMATGTNKRAVRQSDGFHFGCGSSKPSARDVSVHLLHLADLLSSLAHVLRSTRWHDKPACRLREDFFPTGYSQDGHSSDVISELVWLQDAAEKLAVKGCEQTHAEVMGVIQAGNRYPNISPRTEAKLATKGHTTAEHLTLLACTVAEHIAQALGSIKGPAYEQLRDDAQQAYALLTEAKKVIDAGVAYTLDS